MERFLHYPAVIAIAIMLIIAGIITLLCLIRKDRIHSIGKNGIEFNKVDKISTTDLAKRVDSLECDMHTVADELHNVHLALLRLQIISTELQYETKMMLYDEYKSLGGNSYIDSYISKLRGKYEQSKS